MVRMSLNVVMCFNKLVVGFLYVLWCRCCHGKCYAANVIDRGCDGEYQRVGAKAQSDNNEWVTSRIPKHHDLNLLRLDALGWSSVGTPLLTPQNFSVGPSFGSKFCKEKLALSQNLLFGNGVVVPCLWPFGQFKAQVAGQTLVQKRHYRQAHFPIPKPNFDKAFL